MYFFFAFRRNFISLGTKCTIQQPVFIFRSFTRKEICRNYIQLLTHKYLQQQVCIKLCCKASKRVVHYRFSWWQKQNTPKRNVPTEEDIQYIQIWLHVRSHKLLCFAQETGVLLGSALKTTKRVIKNNSKLTENIWNTYSLTATETVNNAAENGDASLM